MTGNCRGDSCLASAKSAPLCPEPLRPRDGDGRIVERGEDVADRRGVVVPHVDAGVDHRPE